MNPTIALLACWVLAAPALADPRGSKTIDLGDLEDVFTIVGNAYRDELGAQTASCDLNADGLEDLVIGNPRGNELFVLFGRRGVWDGFMSIEDVDVRIVGKPGDGLSNRSLECADVNGDQIADLAAGAIYADGPGETRRNAGAVYLFFGRTMWPRRIDVGNGFDGAVVHGPQAGFLMGISLSLGDLDNDGTNDLAIGLADASGGASGSPKTGGVYVLRGRESWASEVDSAVDHLFIVLGEDRFDAVGDEVLIEDLDGDGLNELIVGARLADGPANSRIRAGEISVLRGRQSWPRAIDLALGHADTWIFGEDSEDQLGAYYRIAVADLDRNGERELWLGITGQGPQDDRTSVGEVISREWGEGFPRIVDMATEREFVMFGEDQHDVFCRRMEIGDVDGDGIEDLICGFPGGDGRKNRRMNSGETQVFYGPSTRWGIESVMAEDIADLRILGEDAYDGATVVGTSDLNGDGIRELVIRAKSLSPPDPILTPVHIYIISPPDVDRDGRSQLRDNCPLNFNPTQRDADGDGIGDTCEAG